jgi:hypothetical protein
MLIADRKVTTVTISAIAEPVPALKEMRTGLGANLAPACRLMVQLLETGADTQPDDCDPGTFAEWCRKNKYPSRTRMRCRAGCSTTRRSRRR